MRFLITAGPTREHFDPVRFLSNPSTGKMGFALAEAARKFSRQVYVVSGPTQLAKPRGVQLASIVSAQEMFEAVKRRAGDTDIVLMAAAVCDWRPARVLPRKKKKRSRPETIRLVRTKDILAWLGRHKPARQILVGFAAETHQLLRFARAKLKRKNLDLVVANRVSGNDTGFAADTNRVILLWRNGQVERLPKASKRQVSLWIVQRVIKYARRVHQKD
jgi:phosphopantothenoylcysteine decarboxylase/phosphopantothenate--cysteine ligase